MDYYTAIKFEVIASELIMFGKFFNGYHLSNSLNAFGARGHAKKNLELPML